MTFRNVRYEWVPGSVVVEAELLSEAPTWVMSAMRGRRLIPLASGSLNCRGAALHVAGFMNLMDCCRWDGFIEKHLAACLGFIGAERRTHSLVEHARSRSRKAG